MGYRKITEKITTRLLVENLFNYQAAIIAPIARMDTSEATISKIHNFVDLFIQITSIDELVTINPSQTQKATARPLQTAEVPVMRAEVEAYK